MKPDRKGIFSGKRVILVNPWIYDFAAYDMWAKPLGLLYLGSMLRSYGCEVSLVDCLGEKRVNKKGDGRGKFKKSSVCKPDALQFFEWSFYRYGISPEEFNRALISGRKPDAVLMTSLMTYWYPGVFEAIRIVKNAFNEVPVILGGIYATLCAEHAIRLSGADAVIEGEGEGPLLKSLCKLWDIDFAVQYIGFESDKRPYPCFDLTTSPYVCMTTSRGCPYSCTYCASNKLNAMFLRRNPIKALEEIEYWNAMGISNIAFYDDALLYNPEETIIPLMQGIIDRNLKVFLHCPNGLHADLISMEIADLMKKSGFKTIRLGFETSDPSLQLSTGGKIYNDEFLRSVKNLRDAGYRREDIGVYVLCGLPGQYASQVKESIDFVRLNGARPMLTEYSPIPSTELWESAVKTSPFPIKDEPLFHNNTLLPCRWEGLTYEMYRKIRRSLRLE